MKFPTPNVTAPAGKPFAADLREPGERAPQRLDLHGRSASQRLFEGEIFSSGTRVYDVPALAAGTYFFRCDVHPDMTGTIIAK